MPRTKRPVAKKEKPAEDDETWKKFNKMVNDKKNEIDERALMEIRNIEMAFKMLIGSINSSYLEKTIGELKSELVLNEVPTARATRHSSRTTSRDDAVPKSSSRSKGRRSRSADPSSRMLPPTASKSLMWRRSKSVYRTPACNKNAPCLYPAITPKMNPNTPLTVLRQPRQGEMVVSMSGSPVMVPSCYTLNPNEMANCNIMLQDGTMLSLQPKQLRQSQANIPFSLMNANVLEQLKTLKDNLAKVVQLGEKVMK